MELGIKTFRESLDGFESAFSATQNQLPFKKKTGTYFTSLESLRNFLTVRRLEILHQIREKNPHSIYELAKSIHRTFPSVEVKLELQEKSYL